jgi:quercetin dioxygenase-like cupin family protein
MAAPLAGESLMLHPPTEGAIRSQVNDGPATTYAAGQSFSELPRDRNAVSANASETKPAKLLALYCRR